MVLVPTIHLNVTCLKRCQMKREGIVTVSPSVGLAHFSLGRKAMRTILVVILVLLLVGALPRWPYSSGWGYYPSGGLGLVLVLLLVLMLLGHI